ncbi:Myelin protein zero-like protein 2 [Merluccius polli]|uniref:Myelin protein zero-like protein 2 n=1 Tax=Merluccius polli TaxID=89951 RepID=A0AA47MFX4_MERPO|nr:Myelin protein zero-like protein 2 [Merluccius polli]
MSQTTWLLLQVVSVLLLSGVSAVEVFTPDQVEAVNGSDVRLKCTFTSTHAVSPKTVTVSWNYRPLDQGTREVSVFHYQEVAYPPVSGLFKERVVWSGDVSKRDASITLQGVAPSFNGTYTCQVRNPPDVHGRNGEIVLKVVNKASLSEITLLLAIGGGVCALSLLVVVGYVLVKRRRRSQEDWEVELPERRSKEEWKDPTVW